MSSQISKEKFCYKHPQISTLISCNKCGVNICSKCMISSVIGMRCKNCVQAKRHHLLEIKPFTYIIAGIFSIFIAIVMGFIWGTLANISSIVVFDIILPIVAGFIGRESISIIAKRKRSMGLAMMGVSIILIAFLIKVIIFGVFPSGWLPFIAMAIGSYLVIDKLKN